VPLVTPENRNDGRSSPGPFPNAVHAPNRTGQKELLVFHNLR